ncbi:MAG: hypothetical protein U1E25_12115, partial [Methylocystis sp.]
MLSDATVIIWRGIMFNRLQSSTKTKGFVASGVILFGVALSSLPTCAEELRVGCALVQHYGAAEVRMLLDQVRSSVGDSEASALHAKYVGLRNDCQSNQRAFRVVRL